MPRMTKCRRVCFEPENRIFYPESKNADFIILTVEETEALRLADLENMEQNICADIMNVSRGTFQRILYNARKKNSTCNNTRKRNKNRRRQLYTFRKKMLLQ